LRRRRRNLFATRPAPCAIHRILARGAPTKAEVVASARIPTAFCRMIRHQGGRCRRASENAGPQGGAPRAGVSAPLGSERSTGKRLQSAERRKAGFILVPCPSGARAAHTCWSRLNSDRRSRQANLAAHRLLRHMARASSPALKGGVSGAGCAVSFRDASRGRHHCRISPFRVGLHEIFPSPSPQLTRAASARGANTKIVPRLSAINLRLAQI
jgi:hypothetical protein